MIAKRKGVIARWGLKEAWRKRTSGHRIAKSISIKGTGCKFGGCVRKAVEISSGDLLCVANSRLKASQGALITQQKSAKGIVVR